MSDVRDDDEASADALRQRVREIIEQMAPFGEVLPSAESRLHEDLGFDSLGLIELAFALESELRLPPVLPEQRGITTVGDVEQYVLKVSAPAGTGKPEQ
jgi:acyl carrier protein